MSNLFENAEREFLKLKGQLAAGRITSEQFDAALKDLIVEDAQGKFWMLGSDSGKWYVHDGQTWVEADPPELVESKSKVTAPPMTQPPPKPASKPSGKMRMLVGTAIGGLFTLLVGIAVTWGQGALRSALLGDGATPTRAIAFVTATPSIGRPIPSATIASTTTPIVIILTQPSPMPSLSITPLPTVSLPMPSETPTITFTPTALPATPTIVLPPGLFVTSLRIEPTEPRRGQIIVFYPTFLNTATGEQNPRWLVYIYRRDNLRASFGETAVLGTTIPVGASEQKSAANWRVSGLISCEDYVARVAWQDANKRSTPFNKADGSIYEFGFRVCP